VIANGESTPIPFSATTANFKALPWAVLGRGFFMEQFKKNQLGCVMKSKSTIRLENSIYAVCKKDTLKLESSELTYRPVGHTKRLYRCNNC
jgi:hypothetical protein